MSHTLEFGEPTNGHITLAGEIRCLGGITIDVNKTLQILEGRGPSAVVKTVDYTYHTYANGRGNLFRYCSPHGSGHRPYHHVHRFDVLGTWAELPVEEIRNENDVPTLGDVLAEVRDLYFENEF